MVDIAAHAGGGASIGRDNRPDFYLRGWEDSYAREEMQSLRVLEESLTSRIGMTWFDGAPFRFGSVEKEYCVLAMQTGRSP